jgi:hypothetical protein
VTSRMWWMASICQWPRIHPASWAGVASLHLGSPHLPQPLGGSGACHVVSDGHWWPVRADMIAVLLCCTTDLRLLSFTSST